MINTDLTETPAPTGLGRADRLVVASPTRGTLHPVGLDEVTIVGGLFGRLQELNRSATLDHIESWLERAGWLGNFDAAVAGELPARRQGREFADSEVYKFLEALAWEHARTRDPAVDQRFERIAARVIAAQEPDGYLNTNFGRPGQGARFSDLEWGHELYCAGHLIQAGVARARAVGEDDFVRAVRRVADQVCEAFGPAGIQSVDGHPEIEPALVELYRVTGDHRYLEQARLFVERRGHQVLDDIEFGRAYFQDDLPIRDAAVLRGHAVRATYLSAGAVDLAVETVDEGLLDALAGQWDATVARRTYVTGGMGSHHQDEGFGDDYVLPADRAYSETCAGVGSVMFSWRLLLARGEARYADLIERTVYNVLAASLSEDGRRFFYTNTLHAREEAAEPPADQIVARADSTLRAPWFSVSCCPNNLARTFASLPGYLATVDEHGLQLHQYAPAVIDTALPDGRRIALAIATDYPDSGRIVVRVETAPTGPVTLSLRVPAWASGAHLVVDGSRQPVAAGAYALLARTFVPGDTVELLLPMAVRITRADPRVDAVRGCVALERGPDVLCLESVDVPGRPHVDDLGIDLVEPITETTSGAEVGVRRVVAAESAVGWPYGEIAGVQSVTAETTDRVVLHPYRTWGNRGPTTMRVWLPESTSAE